MDQFLDFLLCGRHKYIHTDLPVCNSGQHVYATGLRNFFFVLQDLIDKILIFREKLFRGTCFLLASNTLRHTFFPMKIRSLHWNGAV